MLTENEMEKVVKPLRGNVDAMVLAWHTKDDNIQQVIMGSASDMAVLVSSLIKRIEERTGAPTEKQIEFIRLMLKDIEDYDIAEADMKS